MNATFFVDSLVGTVYLEYCVRVINGSEPYSKILFLRGLIHFLGFFYRTEMMYSY